MKSTPKFGNKQKGFSILGAFFLLAVLIGAVAFFISGNSVNTSQGQNYTVKARASGVTAQGGYLAGGFNTMIASGIAKASITMDSASGTGLFNPVVGGSTQQTPDNASLIPAVDRGATDGVWQKKNVTINDGGVETYYGFTLSGITETVCQEINASYGVATIPALGAVSTAAAFNLGAIADFDTKQRLCGVATDGKYVYYHTTGVII